MSYVAESMCMKTITNLKTLPIQVRVPMTSHKWLLSIEATSYIYMGTANNEDCFRKTRNYC